MFVWIRAQLCTTGSCCHNPPVPPVQGQAIEPGNWTAFAKMSTRISSIEHLPAKTCLNSLGSSEILAGGCWMTWIENLKQVVNGCEWSVRNQFVFFNSEGGFYHYISTYVVYLFNCSFNINKRIPKEMVVVFCCYRASLRSLRASRGHRRACATLRTESCNPRRTCSKRTKMKPGITTIYNIRVCVQPTIWWWSIDDDLTV
jgi:hypothetical protein